MDRVEAELFKRNFSAFFLSLHKQNMIMQKCKYIGKRNIRWREGETLRAPHKDAKGNEVFQELEVSKEDIARHPSWFEPIVAAVKAKPKRPKKQSSPDVETK